MKYIFFDIDGTLTYDKNGQSYIPASTKQTIQKLQEQGHMVAVATGRSYHHIQEVTHQLGIKYAVCDGGHGIVIENQVVHIKPLDHEVVNQLILELYELQIPFALQIDQNNCLYATSKMLCDQQIEAFEQMPVIVDETFECINQDCFKLFFKLHKGDEALIKSVDASKIMRYFPDQLAFEPDDKYGGVVDFINQVGGNMEDVIFFGDGKNDISMFEKIPYSIAMGNAIEPLKQMAYFVTKGVQEDGIEYACRYLGLI